MLLARCLDKRCQGHEVFVTNYTQAFLNAEVREGEQLYAQPPEEWTPKLLQDGRRVVWKVRKVMLGWRTPLRRLQEHLLNKMKHFYPDTVVAMLAVGLSESTKKLLQELAKDMTMRWCMVTDKAQEFLGPFLCRTPQGYRFGDSCEYVTQLCNDFGFGQPKGSNTLSFEKDAESDTILDEVRQRRHRQLLEMLLYFDRLVIKKAFCQLSTHVNLHKFLIGLTIDGKHAWQQEEEQKGEIGTAVIFQEQLFISELFRDIQDAILLILHSRTMW